MSVQSAFKNVANTMYENLDALDISLDSPILDSIIELDRWIDLPEVWCSFSWVSGQVVFNGVYFTEEDAVLTIPTEYEDVTFVGMVVLGETYYDDIGYEEGPFYFPSHGKGY